MPTYCTRCEEQVHGKAEDQPHLCKDLAKRLARQTKQRDAVLDLMDESRLHGWTAEALAEAIVKKLSQMGVAND